MSVHLYLDQLTDVLRQRFDGVGERIAALGGAPDAGPITVSESTTLLSIPAGPLDVGNALGMRRGQTELGALVIDANSAHPFHALARKDRRLWRAGSLPMDGGGFVEVPPALRAAKPTPRACAVVTRAPHGSPHDLQNTW